MSEEPALLSGSAAESPDQVFRPALEMLERESRQQRRQILQRFTKLGRADINGREMGMPGILLPAAFSCRFRFVTKRARAYRNASKHQKGLGT